jgi:hypothetical protein
MGNLFFEFSLLILVLFIWDQAFRVRTRNDNQDLDFQGGMSMILEHSYTQKKTSVNRNKKSAFINRTNELDYLKHWIGIEPDHILFVYGPKSSGKTTILAKFIEKHLNNKFFDIKHFNLREILIHTYSDFIGAFFEIDYSKSPKGVKQKREYNLKLFKLSKEIITNLENKSLDPFVVMKKELQKIVTKNKCPIIIIDELQALEDIYLNGQRELLKELFNFFVALTKESHLCHVLIASSDGFFLNKLYNDSKLTKTSAFFEIDYLSKKDVCHWLTHLEQESGINDYHLKNEQIETIWNYLGGSMFEISCLLGDLVLTAHNNQIDNQNLFNAIDRLIQLNIGKIEHFAGVFDNKFELLKKILNLLSSQDVFRQRDLKSLIAENWYDGPALIQELNHLVRMNILHFNPTTARYNLHGKSMFFGLKAFVENDS